jgi:hypothetical protein
MPGGTSDGGVWAQDVYSAEQVELDLRAFLHQQGLAKAEVDLIVGCGKASNIPPHAADQWAANWRRGLLAQYHAGGSQAAFVHQQASQDLLPHVPRWSSVLDVNVHEGYVGPNQRHGRTLVEIDEIDFSSQTIFENKTGSLAGLQAQHAKRQQQNPALTLQQVIDEWAARVFTKVINLQDALARPGAVTSKNAPAREATPLVDDFRSFRNVTVRMTETNPQVLQAVDAQLARLQADPRLAGWTIRRQ